MSEKIKPFGDNVAVEIVNQEKSAGGIIIPDKAKSNQRDAIVCRVIGVGPGRVTEYGAMVSPQAKEGDYVLISRGAGVEVELDTRSKDTRRVRILRDAELLGAIEESRIVQLGLVPK
jgi:co-chaperonin GroES (HSP10)